MIYQRVTTAIIYSSECDELLNLSEFVKVSTFF